MYSGGERESTLGQSFKNLGLARKEYVLATEVYSRMVQGRNDVGASRGHIMDAVEASLQRLQTDHIDVYQIHATDSVLFLIWPVARVPGRLSSTTDCPT